MRLLFIDDQPDAIEPAVQAAQDGGYVCSVCGFEDAIERIRSHQPAMVVLDLMQGGVEGTGPQEEAWEPPYLFVWNERFCPIVVFSAHRDELGGPGPDIHHPFVSSVAKGVNGPGELVIALNAMRPHAESLDTTELETVKQLRAAMQVVAPLVAGILPEDQESRVQVTNRLSRRRLAAWLDEAKDGEGLPSAWEQFICPPLESKGLLTGDFLIGPDSDPTEASSFVVVLTPSCDLVGGQQGIKVDDVLVAKCESVKEAVTAVQGGTLPQGPNDSLNRKIEDALSIGYYRNFVFVPELTGVLPCMAINLKALRTIPVAQILGDDAVYRRVSTVDSPFRELLTWAYLQSIGRPGLPDRNRVQWRHDITAQVFNQGQGA